MNLLKPGLHIRWPPSHIALWVLKAVLAFSEASWAPSVVTDC